MIIPVPANAEGNRRNAERTVILRPERHAALRIVEVAADLDVDRHAGAGTFAGAVDLTTVVATVIVPIATVFAAFVLVAFFMAVVVPSATRVVRFAGPAGGGGQRHDQREGADPQQGKLHELPLRNDLERIVARPTPPSVTGRTLTDMPTETELKLALHPDDLPAGSRLGQVLRLNEAVALSIAYHARPGSELATKGDRLRGLRAVGALVASAGLVLLLWPHVQTPASLFAAGSMALAGVCWGVYSVVGKGSKSPMADTAGNFSRAALLMALLWLAVYCAAQAGIHIPGVTVERGLALYTVFLPAPTLAGVLFALASGCLASGIGYAVWYKVLPALPTTSAASVQLSVPVIAALAGVVFLDEALTLTLLLAMFMTLGGVYLVLRVTR